MVLEGDITWEINENRKKAKADMNTVQDNAFVTLLNDMIDIMEKLEKLENV